jgi:hypothetical protein
MVEAAIHWSLKDEQGVHCDFRFNMTINKENPMSAYVWISSQANDELDRNLHSYHRS